MTSSRILSPKRAGCAVILVVSFLAPVSFFAVSLPALLLAVAFFTDGDFCSGFGSFFLIFLFRQSSHLIYFHILQIKIFQYIILSQNSFARKYTLASAKTKVSCFFRYFDCKESATTVPRISAKPIRSMPWNFACKKRRETMTAVIGSTIPSRLPIKGPTTLTPFK